MFNLGTNKNRKYHKFEYHPRSYQQQKSNFQRRVEKLKEKSKNESFDVLDEYLKKKPNKKISITNITILILLFVVPFLFSDFQTYLETKYRFGGIAAYFLLILVLFIYIKRSKRIDA